MRTPLTILVTGSSSGFGHLTSVTLARRGHRVFASMRDVLGRNAPAALELHTLADDEQLELSVLDLDVREDRSATQAIDSVLTQAGNLDVLINNAGAGFPGMLETVSVEQARELFEINVHSVLRMNRAVLPHMRTRRSGLLVHVSSGLARFILPFNGLYSATKCALEAIAETYRYELASVGVDSVIVEPGLYATGFARAAANFEPADPDRAAAYGELYRRSLDARNRTSGSDDPLEVAEAIADLVELPAGSRPLRTTVGPIARRSELLNATAAELQQTVFDQAGLLNLVTLPEGATTTQDVV